MGSEVLQACYQVRVEAIPEYPRQGSSSVLMDPGGLPSKEARA